MKILIASGLSGQDVGGPAQYGPNLKESFTSLGHSASLVTYSRVERALPVGLRHIYFALRIIPRAIRADHILALDTFSVGVPSTIVSRIFRKKLIIRVGGDFLYSAYINRTSDNLTLPEFYEKIPNLNLKERLIYKATKTLIKKADFLAFNTAWQEDIWKRAYRLTEGATGVVRNFVPKRLSGEISGGKRFLWAGRIIPEKNISMIRRVGEQVGAKYPDFSLDIITNELREKILEKLRTCYAVVSPALTDICPNFIIEGISFGKPFLVTRETGLNELYPKGGVYLDPKNEQEWVREIEKMLEEKVYYDYKRDLTLNTYKHLWSELASDFLNIWKSL